MSLLHTFLDLL